MIVQHFSQIGKRSNNEDSIGCTGGLLTVCDGMGGHNYGERASAFVVEAMIKAFEMPSAIGKTEIQQQLDKVQTDLNQLLEKEPELEKMGTTFTGVFLTPNVWYAAHIGDSRIYLFRPSEQKLWHTWDHSLVGELMRTREITIEAGRFHPLSNRIGKAIIAQKDGKPSSASIVKIDELKAGDIILLCSDGVVESWGDWELVRLFSDTSLSFEQKCEKIAQQCDANSNDNNTALIAEIEAQDAFSFGKNEELEWTSFAEVEADYRKYCADNEIPVEGDPVYPMPVEAKPQPANHPMTSPSPQGKASNKAPKKRKLLVVLLIIIAIALLAVAGLGAYWLLKDKGTKEKPENQPNTELVSDSLNQNQGTDEVDDSAEEEQDDSVEESQDDSIEEDGSVEENEDDSVVEDENDSVEENEDDSTEENQE